MGVLGFVGAFVDESDDSGAIFFLDDERLRQR